MILGKWQSKKVVVKQTNVMYKVRSWLALKLFRPLVEAAGGCEFETFPMDIRPLKCEEASAASDNVDLVF